MENFLNALPVHHDLKLFFDSDDSHSVPDDWYVAVADIRGSTQAIESGHYRDVNFVGAACITALLQKLGPHLPFSFGGDGAAVLIDQSMYSRAEAILSSLISWSESCFNLTLHAGLVSVAELKSSGKDVRIARYRQGSGPVQTLFTGGGISLAEERVKQNESLRISPSNPPEYEQAEIFNGLTCRWQPIPAKHGVVVSLLIEPIRDDWEGMPELFERLQSIFDGTLEAASPIDMKRARYRSFWDNLKRQHQVSGFGFNRNSLSELAELLLTVPLFNLKGFRLTSRIENYVNKIPEHCDYQKLDDTLRMVLDCSDDQCRRIKAMLDEYHASGAIAYGMHNTSAAQMTCYVESLSDAGHFHFVDGNDGGYALAAKMLKQQLRG